MFSGLGGAWSHVLVEHSLADSITAKTAERFSGTLPTPDSQSEPILHLKGHKQVCAAEGRPQRVYTAIVEAAALTVWAYSSFT